VFEEISALAPAGCGLAIGLAAAFALARVLRALLYQVSATDPSTFLPVPLLLPGVAAAASYCSGSPGGATGSDAGVAG
jgi:hypothetical protein